MRWWIAIVLLACACDGPLIVDCDDGVFAEVDGEAWCVYERRAVDCPDLLPVEHDLPWGGRGCAEREHETVPTELCAATDACTDGGM